LAFGYCVDKRGDTMAGDLTLARDPVTPMMAATKQYLDNQLAMFAPPGVYSFNGRVGTVTLQGTDVSNAGALMRSGGMMTSAIHWTDPAASAPNDLSKQLDLYNGTFGISITSARMNLVVPVGSSLFVTAGDNTDILQCFKGSIRPLTMLDF